MNKTLKVEITKKKATWSAYLYTYVTFC